MEVVDDNMFMWCVEFLAGEYYIEILCNTLEFVKKKHSSFYILTVNGIVIF